ncbi:hypothetical protein G6O69_27170 [Pseudenhygromyxa sp. WMMC2535]|nr:hypothetical protein [Pseudenhygromyxa sp. WMMC2535]NVB41550.1 hypothetical protein [Pseudenhygromyxa sp. WMMC2535]
MGSSPAQGSSCAALVRLVLARVRSEIGEPDPQAGPRSAVRARRRAA